jgi:uncharacterized protein YndB with AHSA1/START domain
MGVSDADADAAAEFGTLERAGGVSILRYERRLAHPRARVWRALTEDAELAAWFPTTMDGRRQAGAALRFTFRQGEGPPFDGEMLAFVPPSLMELRWADDVLRFELEDAPGPAGTACILRLRVTFPEHGKAARDAAGWHVCLERMTARCDDDDVPPRDEPSARWQEVHRVYVERLGAAASVIGPPEHLIRSWGRHS